MRYTKKMILVDFDKNPNLKSTDGDVFEMTAALKALKQPGIQKVVVEPTEVADFDRATSSVLKNNKLSDGDKIGYYNELLRRYRLSKDTVIKDRETQNEKLLRKVMQGVNMDGRRRAASPTNEMGPPQTPPARKKPKKATVPQFRASAGSSDSSWSTDAARRRIKKKLIIEPMIKQIFPNHVFSDEDEDEDDTVVDSGGSQFGTPRQSDAGDDDDDDYDHPSIFGAPRRISGKGRISSWAVLK